MRNHTLGGRALRATLALLLLVPLFAYISPGKASAEGAVPYSIYTFYFANGQVLSGDSRDPDTRGKFEVPVFETGRTIHVSCSAVFDDGWSSNPPAFPTQSVDGPDWEILSYHIIRDGDKKTCGETFTPGSITVIKDADSATESFAFGLSGLIAPPPPEGGAAIAVGPFLSGPVLGDDFDSFTWNELSAGDYTLAELMTQEQTAAGWVFDSLSCDNDASSQTTPQVRFELAGGEHVTCRFTNTAGTTTKESTTTTGATTTTTGATTTTTGVTTTTTGATTTTTVGAEVLATEVTNTTVAETLPFTGPTSTGMGGIGAALLLLGGLVLLAFRKKDDPVVETGVVTRLSRYHV